MSLIDAVGISLSAVAVLAFAWLLFDVFGSTSAVPFRRRRVAVWLWAVLLSASFLAGLYGIRFSGSIEENGIGRTFARAVDSRWSAVRLPFYVVTTKEERARGGVWRITDRRGELQLPWPFIGGALAYHLLGRGGRGRRFTSGRATPARSRLSLG